MSSVVDFILDVLLGILGVLLGTLGLTLAGLILRGWGTFIRPHTDCWLHDSIRQHRVLVEELEVARAENARLTAELAKRSAYR